MKKAIAILMLTMLLVMSFAQADVEFDLSYLSLDELVKLQNAVTLAMWNTDEWQEVRVPAGTYKIGESIPAGTWTIKPVKGNMVLINYGDALDESMSQVKYSLGMVKEFVVSTTYGGYSEGLRTELTLNMVEGRYIELSGAVIFTTPVPATFNFKN